MKSPLMVRSRRRQPVAPEYEEVGRPPRTDRRPVAVRCTRQGGRLTSSPKRSQSGCESVGGCGLYLIVLLLDKLGGGEPAEARVRPESVEVPTPALDLDLGGREVREPVHAQAFVPELPVEGFDEGVLDGFPGRMN